MCIFGEPGLTHREDFASGTAAAALGDVTTALVMTTDVPTTFTAAERHTKAVLAEGHVHTDIGHLVAATRPDHIAALASASAVAIEVLLGDISPALLLRDEATQIAVMRACRTSGIVRGVRPAAGTVIAAAEALPRRPGCDPIDFLASRPAQSEALGTVRAHAAAGATGAALHLRQTSCVESLALVQQAMPQGLDLTAETTPHNLLLEADEIRRQGPRAKILPTSRSAADHAALWPALRERGGTSCVATDHTPHSQAEKPAGMADIWAAPGGFPGVQTVLALMLDAEAPGRIGWGDLVRLTSGAPAQRFSLRGKGSLVEGSQADFVLVDPSRRARTTDAQQSSRAGRPPFAGREVTGWPVSTWLRGHLIATEAALLGAPRGQVLRRGA